MKNKNFGSLFATALFSALLLFQGCNLDNNESEMILQARNKLIISHEQSC